MTIYDYLQQVFITWYTRIIYALYHIHRLYTVITTPYIALLYTNIKIYIPEKYRKIIQDFRFSLGRLEDLS